MPHAVCLYKPHPPRVSGGLGAQPWLIFLFATPFFTLLQKATLMKAVGLKRYLPITDNDSLLDLDLPQPTPGAHDLIVKVEAVSVNPVDTKQRNIKGKTGTAVPQAANGGAGGASAAGGARVLGFDAAGTVHAVGSAVTLFKAGDRVYYAGDVTRPGSNSEYHAVDERIVGHMPASLDFAQAAALPLTAITAWEALFDRLRVAAPPHARPQKSVLIIGGAGGVGSIAIQLAAKVAGLLVIATASRPESIHWCKDHGATHVVNHFGDLAAEVRALGIAQVDYVLIFNDTDAHLPAACNLLAPQGGICSIVRTMRPVDMEPLMSKCATFTWEFMFTRPAQKTPDMIQQHHLLDEVARLIDQGILKTTATTTLSPINAANMKQAHAQVEGGRTIGKVVLRGW